MSALKWTRLEIWIFWLNFCGYWYKQCTRTRIDLHRLIVLCTAIPLRLSQLFKWDLRLTPSIHRFLILSRNLFMNHIYFLPWILTTHFLWLQSRLSWKSAFWTIRETFQWTTTCLIDCIQGWTCAYKLLLIDIELFLYFIHLFFVHSLSIYLRRACLIVMKLNIGEDLLWNIFFFFFSLFLLKMILNKLAQKHILGRIDCLCICQRLW